MMPVIILTTGDCLPETMRQWLLLTDASDGGACEKLMKGLKDMKKSAFLKELEIYLARRNAASDLQFTEKDYGHEECHKPTRHPISYPLTL